MTETAQAGWYREGDRARYWDGSAWTDDYRDLPPPRAGSKVEPADPPVVPDALKAAAGAFVGAMPTKPRLIQQGPDDLTKRKSAATVMLIGAAAIAGGAFLPWLKITAPFVGTITKSGVDDVGDGVICVVLAGVLALIALRMRTGEVSRSSRRAAGIGAMVILILLGALVLYDFNQVSDRLTEIRETDLAAAGHGPGLALVALGAVTAAVGWMQMPWSVPKEP